MSVLMQSYHCNAFIYLLLFACVVSVLSIKLLHVKKKKLYFWKDAKRKQEGMCGQSDLPLEMRYSIMFYYVSMRHACLLALGNAPVTIIISLLLRILFQYLSCDINK